MIRNLGTDGEASDPNTALLDNDQRAGEESRFHCREILEKKLKLPLHPAVRMSVEDDGRVDAPTLGKNRSEIRVGGDYDATVIRCSAQDFDVRRSRHPQVADVDGVVRLVPQACGKIGGEVVVDEEFQLASGMARSLSASAA